jgi:L-alanine-DL-glutamate epimerase-like enolase superfamily enzyme
VVVDSAARSVAEKAWGFYQGDPSVAWEQFVLHDGPLVKDGRIQVPDKPGLGVEPNPDYARPPGARRNVVGRLVARLHREGTGAPR